MKIDDIAKQLANKINQEHYIKHYLEKIQRGAYNKGVKDEQAKQLILSGVVGQSEQLPLNKTFFNKARSLSYTEFSKWINTILR